MLPNDCGTAPGCIIEDGPVRVVMLPGPPRECVTMLRNYVMPYLQKLSGAVIRSHMIRFFGIGESAMETRLRSFMDGANPTVAPYSREGECWVRVTAKGANEQECEALMEPVIEDICDKMGDLVYGIDCASLEERVLQLLQEKNTSLAVAESCTGGMVAASLVDYPGISECLYEAHVTYANEAKVKYCGVKPETLAAFGAVSEQTAFEMASGLRERSGADIAVATTGIAGPGGGTKEKPVGLVYVACADKDGVTVERLQLGGDRARVRRLATLKALDMVRRLAQKQPVDRARMFKANSDFDWNAPLKKRRSSKYAAPIAVLAVLLVALAVACWYFFTHFSLGGGNGAGGALPVSGSTSISTSASSGEPASVPGTDASVSQPAGDGGSGTPDAGGASSTPQSSGNTGVVHPFG